MIVLMMKNLHCSPLKLYDYFLAGLPVVATPILAISEFKDLIYSGATAQRVVRCRDSSTGRTAGQPEASLRMEVARAHSTEALGQRLEEVLKTSRRTKGKMQ